MKIREESIVEEFEANRAKSALLLFENAVCAETTVDGSVGDSVEEERGCRCEAATVAWLR